MDVVKIPRFLSFAPKYPRLPNTLAVIKAINQGGTPTPNPDRARTQPQNRPPKTPRVPLTPLGKPPDEVLPPSGRPPPRLLVARPDLPGSLGLLPRPLVDLALLLRLVLLVAVEPLVLVLHVGHV